LLAPAAGSYSPDDHDAGAIGGFNYYTAVLIITGRTLLAQFGLTPKSRRGLGAGDVVDPLDGA
jgi:hypothetical protein